MERDAKESCGVFGVFGKPSAAFTAYYGLYSLQHRGQESVGVVTSDTKQFYSLRRMGLVGEALNDDNLSQLKGHIAVGHVRYSTTGASKASNIQPIVMECSHDLMAIGHNGNLVNAHELRRNFEERGSIFQTTTDSEIVLHLLASPEATKSGNPVLHTMQQLKGAYCFILMTEDKLIGVRDPFGWRPLSIGELPYDKVAPGQTLIPGQSAYVLASETCAFDLIGAKFVRDVEPGEIVTITSNGIESAWIETPKRRAHCIFEYVYFARPDSILNGDNIHIVRKKLGAQLAKEHPVDADLVIAVPDSGNSAALGFAEGSGIPFEMGFIRNHYVGRTFINPVQTDRETNVNIKLNIVRELIQGKRLVVVDDSIVRGNTSKLRVAQLRKAGAKEVHLRISCPPTKFPCYYGIDFSSKGELIAANKSIEEIRNYLDLDSLGYLSVEGMLAAASRPAADYCDACFTGKYPIPIPPDLSKTCMDQNLLEF